MGVRGRLRHNSSQFITKTCSAWELCALDHGQALQFPALRIVVLAGGSTRLGRTAGRRGRTAPRASARFQAGLGAIGAGPARQQRRPATALSAMRPARWRVGAGHGYRGAQQHLPAWRIAGRSGANGVGLPAEFLGIGDRYDISHRAAAPTWWRWMRNCRLSPSGSTAASR